MGRPEAMGFAWLVGQGTFVPQKIKTMVLALTRATKRKVSLQQRGANGIQFSLKVEVLPLDKLETGQGYRYQVSKSALFWVAGKLQCM